MLSRSTPDLREGSTPSVPIITSLVGRSGPVAPGTGTPSHAAGPAVPRPGSAPATKFSDGDSVFEEGIEAVDPTGDFGDIFSVLSIDDDSKHTEADQVTAHDKGGEPTNSESTTDEEAGDQNPGTEDPGRPQVFPGSGGVFRSVIPAIIEVSGEDSDSYYQSKPRYNPRDKAGLDFKPRQVKYLQTPQVCVSMNDDTSSDSSDEGEPIAPPPAHRPGAASRRRHSLGAVTLDTVTRMLLSNRRGSSSGPPVPCANCSQKTNCESSSSQCARPTEKQVSSEGDKYSRPSNRSNSQHLLPHPAAQPYHGGRRRSFSGYRMGTAEDAALGSSMHIRPVSPEPLSGAGDYSPRPVSPRPVYLSSSGRRSPRSQSPTSRSPGLVRQTSIPLRDEIAMFLSATAPTTPPQSPSLSPTVPSQEQPRSPPSETMPSGHQSFPNAPSHWRARSPRPRSDRHDGRLSRRPSELTSDAGDPESSLRPNLGVQGKPSRTRSRSPAPHSLKPDHRPSSRRSSLTYVAKTAESSSPGGGGLSRRPSNAPRIQVQDDSDSDGGADPERVAPPDRRRRQGSQPRILLPSDPQQLVLPARRSRRKSICVSHPAKDETSAPGAAEKAHILAKLSKRSHRRSSWAATGEPLVPLTSVSALTLLRKGTGNAGDGEETEQTKDHYALTLHFITDPGRSEPLRKILRPLIESIVPKLKLFNFVERSESAARDPPPETADGTGEEDRFTTVPTLGVVLLLQEEFGMERILEAQRYLAGQPWELHHRGEVGNNNVPYPTNHQDFYAHPGWPDAALWAVRQVHFGKDRLRFQLFVSSENWADTMDFYGLLLSRPTHVGKADFCYFLVFCSQTLNLEVQLALKRLPPGFKPQFLDSTILQFKVGDVDQLAPLLPRPCISISDKRWQTADPDGNKVLLFRDGDSCATPTTPDSPDTPDRLATLMPPSRDAAERPSHIIPDYGVHVDEWMQESNLVSAV